MSSEPVYTTPAEKLRQAHSTLFDVLRTALPHLSAYESDQAAQALDAMLGAATAYESLTARFHRKDDLLHHSATREQEYREALLDLIHHAERVKGMIGRRTRRDS